MLFKNRNVNVWKNEDSLTVKMNKEVLYLRWNKRLLKAYFLTQVLPCEISEISKNTFSTEHLPATAFVF